MLRRTFSGFKRLPESGSGRAWWNVLGVSRHAGHEEIITAYRAKAQKTHPDKPGGSEEAWHKLREARRQALEAVGASTAA